MKQIIVRGGRALCGEITVSGSKNAALPIIFSTIACRGISRLDNLPLIGDVKVALRIIEKMGARVSYLGRTVLIDTRNMYCLDADSSLTSRIRASSYLIGASLVRFERYKLSDIGGCNFSNRPIDLHLYAAQMLGASVSSDIISVDGVLRGGIIRFPIASVGATANALIMACGAQGRSEIYNYAREPHIFALADFLSSAGAHISFDDEKITVDGAYLGGGECVIIGDMIEAGTYLASAIVTRGEVIVRGVCADQMCAFIDFLSASGCEVYVRDDLIGIAVREVGSYSSIVASPYPGFATDLQPIAAAVMASLSGGDITDLVWRERFGYLDALSDFGVRSDGRCDRARVHPSQFCSAHSHAPDLRGGAACLLAALGARGESIIDDADLILRGYDDLDNKLRHLGADIEIKDIS